MRVRRAAVGRASGDWYVFTDADIHDEPDLLRRAMRAALHRDADHLSLIPETRANGFWHAASVSAFVTALIGLMPGETAPEETDDFVGVGAFNLVRREAFERTEGFEWLRLEIGDDAGLGLLINRHGGRSVFGFATEGIGMDVYDSRGDAVRGLEKNGFPVMAGFRWVHVLAGAATWLLGVAGPIVGLVQPGLGAWPFSLAAIGAMVLLAVVGGRSTRPPAGAVPRHSARATAPGLGHGSLGRPVYNPGRHRVARDLVSHRRARTRSTSGGVVIAAGFPVGLSRAVPDGRRMADPGRSRFPPGRRIGPIRAIRPFSRDSMDRMLVGEATVSVTRFYAW